MRELVDRTGGEAVDEFDKDRLDSRLFDILDSG